MTLTGVACPVSRDDLGGMPQRLAGRRVAPGIHRIGQALELGPEPLPVALIRPGPGPPSPQPSARGAKTAIRVSQRTGGQADGRTVMVCAHAIQYSSGKWLREMLVRSETGGRADRRTGRQRVD